MGLLGDFVNEAAVQAAELDRNRFSELLSDFASDFDWTSVGPLKGLGGESGAHKALELLRAARRAAYPIPTGTSGQ